MIQRLEIAPSVYIRYNDHENYINTVYFVKSLVEKMTKSLGFVCRSIWIFIIASIPMPQAINSHVLTDRNPCIKKAIHVLLMHGFVTCYTRPGALKWIRIIIASGRWFSKLISIRIVSTCHDRPFLVGSGFDKIIIFIELSPNCFKKQIVQ